MLGIPRALWTLNRLQMRAGWRRFTRSLRTVRGLLLTLFTAVIFLVWLGPTLAAAFLTEEAPRLEYPIKVGGC